MAAADLFFKVVNLVFSDVVNDSEPLVKYGPVAQFPDKDSELPNDATKASFIF